MWCELMRFVIRNVIYGRIDVWKVLKIAFAYGSCSLRIFKTSGVTINYEMHEQVHDMAIHVLTTII